MSEHREWRLLCGGLIVRGLAGFGSPLVAGAHVSEHLWPAAHRSWEHARFTLTLLPAVPVIFASQGVYRPQNLLAGTREYAAVFRACTYVLVVAIIGSFALRAEGSREWLLVSWGLSTEVVGVLDDYLPVGAELAGGFRVLGTSARLAQIAERTRADEVIVVPQALPWESLQRLMAAGAALDGLRMHLLGGFYDLLATGVQLSQPNGVPMLTIRKV